MPSPTDFVSDLPEPSAAGILVHIFKSGETFVNLCTHSDGISRLGAGGCIAGLQTRISLIEPSLVSHLLPSCVTTQISRFPLSLLRSSGPGCYCPCSYDRTVLQILLQPVHSHRASTLAWIPNLCWSLFQLRHSAGNLSSLSSTPLTRETFWLLWTS